MTGAAAPPVPQISAQFMELASGVLVTRMVEVLMRTGSPSSHAAGRRELACDGLPDAA